MYFNLGWSSSTVSIEYLINRPCYLPFSEIEDRLEAVTELTNADSAIFVKFAEILSSLPDVEKALTTIIHGKVD